MSTTPPSPRSGVDAAVAVALIAIPWATALVKFIAPGWMLLFYLFGLVVFIPLYVLVIVIGISGFVGSRPAFLWAGAGRIRARIAGLLHPLAFLAATAFLEDGGDSGDSQSPVEVIFWLDLPAELSGAISYGFVMLSLGALIWLVVEWIVALVKRGRAGTTLTG